MTERTTTLSREDLRRPGRGGRAYVWPANDPEQRTYTSVTTALKAIPKGEALTRWAAKTTAEVAVEQHDLLGKLIENDPENAVQWLKQAPWNSRDRAANIGTFIHRIVEYDTTGRELEADELVRGIEDPLTRQKAISARHFFQVTDVAVEAVEFVTYHHGFGYAGTGDFIVTFNDPDLFLPNVPFKENPTVILDLKTGKGIYPEVALQLAAYRWAESIVNFETGELEPMMQTDGAAVLHVTHKGWTINPVMADEATFLRFVHTLKMMDEVLPLKDDLVGTPMMRGKPVFERS